MQRSGPFAGHDESSSERADAPPLAPDGIDRRRFGLTLAGLIAAPLATSSLSAEGPAVPVEDLGVRPADLSDAEWGEVQSRYRNLIRVYSDRLNLDQRRVLLNVLIGNERMLSSIRQFGVKNGDPAALTLRLVTRGMLV